MPSVIGADAEVGETRRAWKFLAPGAVSPFAGLPWPQPSAGKPGTWVSPPGGGVFACRLADLPWWIDAELWEIQLAAPVEEFDTQLRAPAARLVALMPAWDETAFLAYGAACAFRARDWTVEALLAERCPDDAAALRSCETLADLAAQARIVQGTSRAANLAAFTADSAARASLGNAGAAANMSANAAILYRGAPDAFHRERAWQAAWIAQRAHLGAQDSA